MLDRRELEGFRRFFCEWANWIDMIINERYNIVQRNFFMGNKRIA